MIIRLGLNYQTRYNGEEFMAGEFSNNRRNEQSCIRMLITVHFQQEASCRDLAKESFSYSVGCLRSTAYVALKLLRSISL